MKKILALFILMTACAIAAYAQPKDDVQTSTASSDAANITPIITGYSLILHSAIIGEDRKVEIAVPEGYYDSVDRYSVMYLTDGQWGFNLAVQTADMLAHNGVIPKMIVVGINTGDHRTRDLLPVREERSGQGGGADKLLGFIKNELIPYVDAHYRTLDYRVLDGTSNGGVFVMHTLMSDSQLFNAYLALSPAVGWNDGYMLKQTKTFLSKTPVLSKYLFLAVANEGSNMGVDALAELLENGAPKQLVWKFNHYPEEIHTTMTYKSSYDGLKFVFADWRNDPTKFDVKGELVREGDAVSVRLKCPGSSVRYTTDGTAPTLQSPLYEQPIVVKSPQTIKALSVFGAGIPGRVDSLVIRRVSNPLPVK